MTYSSTDEEDTFLEQLLPKKSNLTISIKSIYDEQNVFEDEDVYEYYKSLYESCNYDCQHLFDNEFRWSSLEETEILSKLDFSIAIFACILFVSLQLIRGNLQSAISDNLLGDLKLSNDDYNLANTIFLLCFLLAEIPSSVIANTVGFKRFIPFQIISWSIVSCGQGFIQTKWQFFICRGLIATFQSGLIPQLVVFLSTFYKSNELPSRLSWIWITQSLVQISSSLFSLGILNLRGIFNMEGWRWLFVLEGLFSLTIGICSIKLLISSPIETTRWFNQREIKIMVNRILRDDPMKGYHHHGDDHSFRNVWRALANVDLIPIYILGLIAYIPQNTATNYLAITIKQLGWDTLQTNLLLIPYNILHMIALYKITQLANVLRQRSVTALLVPLYLIPLLAFLKFYPNSMVNGWETWALLTLIAGTPSIHAICVSWVSHNAGDLQTRTISSAIYNVSVQLGLVIAANIYHDSDAPLYNVGNTHLLWIAIILVPYLILVKLFYTSRNNRKAKKWSSMNIEMQSDYLHSTTDRGNKRLDFKLVS